MTSKRHSGFLFASLTAVLAFLVYWLTVAPDLTWSHYGGDGGELITAAVTLGVPHPPGYPTYVLLGNVISRLPIGSVAYRFNLFTAVCTAVAAGFVTATAHVIPPKRQKWAGALAAGLTFAFLPLVWNQALITEVYGLNLLLLAASLWALFSGRPAWLVGCLWGLALTTHLTAVFMLPLILIVIPQHNWKWAAAGAVLGLLPFLALPLLAQTDSPVVWGDPTTLTEWWWLVSGALYRPNLFSLPVSGWFERAGAWSFMVLLPSILLSLMALWSLKISEKEVQLKILILFLTAVATLCYAFTYQTDDAAVFALPAMLTLSLAAAPAWQKLNHTALILPLICLLLNFNSQNLRSENRLRPIVESILKEAPPQAIIMTDGAPDVFAFWYFHIVENQRPDIIIVDNLLFQFDWYRERLQRQHPALAVPQGDNLNLLQAQNDEERPFCFVEKIEETQVEGPVFTCSHRGMN